LAYEVKANELDEYESKEESSGDEQMEKRQIFENNMQALGLELEYVTSKVWKHFFKFYPGSHTPTSTLDMNF